MSPALVLQCLAALTLLLPAAAPAQQLAHTTRQTDMRAGPDPVFPLVTWLPARASVNVTGCTVDERWCDVAQGRSRGWIAAADLSIQGKDRIPTVTFEVDAYWNTHYRSRPWYPDRPLWAKWGTPDFQPPPTR